MNDLRVLMIGPGEPNADNSGLGVASNHIAKALAKKTSLTIIQPDNYENLSEQNLIKDLVKINVSAQLNPYFYADSSLFVGSKEKPGKPQDSSVKKELNKFTDQVVRKSRSEKFDIIYAHDWTAIPAALKIKHESKKPMVVHMHSLDHDRGSKLDQSWVYELEKESLEQSDAIITVSDYTSEVIKENYTPEVEEKVHVVHNAIDELEYERKENPFAEKLVIFVGRLTGQKGPSIFLDIAELVLKKNENVRFVMAGDGKMMFDLIASAATKNIGSKFHFTGRLDQEKLQDLYSMADVFCMPSVSEPFGLTALEAANAGIPVVLSKQSGASEVLKGSYEADHWDTETFAGHIIDILKTKNKKQVAKNVALNKKDLNKLSWENTAEKILDIFNTLS